MAVCHRDGGVVSQTHRIVTSICKVNVCVVSTYIVSFAKDFFLQNLHDICIVFSPYLYSIYIVLLWYLEYVFVQYLYDRLRELPPRYLRLCGIMIRALYHSVTGFVKWTQFSPGLTVMSE